MIIDEPAATTRGNGLPKGAAGIIGDSSLYGFGSNASLLGEDRRPADRRSGHWDRQQGGRQALVSG